MKKTQQGFTLIELMIVVAIIGILAAIAIPAYQDYTIRAKVSEGLNLASGAKAAVTEYYQDKGSFPSDNATAGLPAATDIKGNNVSKVEVGQNGVITITYSGGGTNLNGKTVTLTPAVNNGSISWTCAAGTLAAKYLPSSCR